MFQVPSRLPRELVSPRDLHDLLSLLRDHHLWGRMAFPGISWRFLAWMMEMPWFLCRECHAPNLEPFRKRGNHRQFCCRWSSKWSWKRNLVTLNRQQQATNKGVKRNPCSRLLFLRQSYMHTCLGQVSATFLQWFHDPDIGDREK